MKLEFSKSFSILTLFLFIFILYFTFNIDNNLYAQQSLEDYADEFYLKLDSEFEIINDFTSDIEMLDSDSIYIFQSKLNNFRNSLKPYLSFYNSVPLESPNSLKSASNNGYKGTDLIINGADEIDSAISLEDENLFSIGVEKIDRGINHLNLAVDQYNNFVDEYNSNGSFYSVLFGITKNIGIPLIIAFFYLLFIGLILNKNFNNKVKKLIKGDLKTERFTTNGIYGFHLIILFIFIYVTLIFSIIILIDFVSLALFATGFFIAVAIIGISTFWALIKGLLGRSKKYYLGFLIKEKDSPKIWKLCRKVAKDLDTPPPDRIYLSPLPQIGVMLDGGLFNLLIGKAKRILVIGKESINTLTDSEISAILAHEFGHFSNKDTKWNSLTFTIGNALTNTIRNIPNPLHIRGCILKILSFFNPVLWMLLISYLLYLVLTNGFSRIREVFADKTAIELYEYKNFKNGLLKVVRNDYLFSNNIDQPLDTLDIEEIDRKILTEEKSSIFNSHPLLRDRLEYGKSFEKS